MKTAVFPTLSYVRVVVMCCYPFRSRATNPNPNLNPNPNPFHSRATVIVFLYHVLHLIVVEQVCPNRPPTMTSDYFDQDTEFEDTQRTRRQRMVERFIGQQEAAVRPLLLDALSQDLKDLGIVVEPEAEPEVKPEAEEAVVDPSVIQLILELCPSATPTMAVAAMKTHNNDIGRVVNMLQGTA